MDTSHIYKTASQKQLDYYLKTGDYNLTKWTIKLITALLRDVHARAEPSRIKSEGPGHAHWRAGLGGSLDTYGEGFLKPSAPAGLPFFLQAHPLPYLPPIQGSPTLYRFSLGPSLSLFLVSSCPCHTPMHAQACCLKVGA